MAAIGVGLLFANTTAQRVLLELSQREDAQRRSLAALVEQQPHIELGISKALVDASFGLVATIPEYAEVCQFSVSLDPRCSVAKKMEPAISDFLKVTRSSLGETLEANLANTCPAADKMILDLSGSSRMSELVGDELMAQYKQAIEKKLPSLSVDPLKMEIDAFKKRVGSKLNSVQSALGDSSEAGKYVMDTYMYEADFAEILMQGLLPCITSPRKDIDVLANWTKSRQTERDQLEKFEAQRQRVINDGAPFPKLAHIQLFIWPYVLILALSLKFAKGVAAVRSQPSASKAVPVVLATASEATDVPRSTDLNK